MPLLPPLATDPAEAAAPPAALAGFRFSSAVHTLAITALAGVPLTSALSIRSTASLGSPPALEMRNMSVSSDVRRAAAS